MIRSLQGCRGLAALLVVLHHTSMGIVALPKYFDARPFGDFFHFGMAGVDFFFVLSGFIIGHVHGADVGHPERLGEYFWKRLSRVYPTYWAAMLPLIPVFFLFPHFGGGYERDPFVIARSILLLPDFAIQQQLVLGVAWSLTFELPFYLLFATFIVSRRLGLAVFGGWALLQAAVLAGWLTGSPWWFFGDATYCAFFAGLLLAPALRRCTVPYPRLLAVAGAALFLATGMTDVYVMTLTHAQRALGYTPASVLILAGVIEAERSGGLQTPRLLVFLGDAGYSIYLTHFPALSVLAKIAKALHVDAWVPSPLLFLGLAAGAVAVGCAFYLAVERPLTRWLRRPPAPSLAAAPTTVELPPRAAA